MFVYFFPLFGAMLADSFLGKFRYYFEMNIITSLFIQDFLVSLKFEAITAIDNVS